MVDFGCCGFWMECLYTGVCLHPETKGGDTCAMELRLAKMGEVERAAEHARWLENIKVLSSTTKRSIKFGIFKDRPTIVYMFVGPIPYFYRIGEVPYYKDKPAKPKQVTEFCNECQEAIETLAGMTEGKPKTEPEIIEFLRLMVPIKEDTE